MNFKWQAFTLISTFLFLQFHGFSSPSVKPCTFHIHKIETRYTQISEKSGFQENVLVTGTIDKETQEIIKVPFTELETVSQLEAQYTENGKQRSIKDFATHSLYTSSFYSGINCKTFVFDKKATSYDVQYSYVLKNSQLMFLSFLPFNSHNCVDTFKYSIIVPGGMNLIYELDGDTSQLKNYQITHNKVGNETEWEFIAITKQRYFTPENSYFAIESAKNIPGVRINLIPDLYSTKNYAYINNWYNQLLVSQSDLNPESINIITKWGKNKNGTELIKTLFDSIKSKISYIAFENGLGAVQPRNVNDVLRNRQGDCKDMANLLRQSIRHFGIPAWVALSSTLSHPYDLDFPSVFSANHAICVAENEGKTYYLDATEAYGLFGFPSRQIQGKHIFKIDSLNGQLLKIPIVSPAENRVTGKFYLTQIENKLIGKFTYTLMGLSKIDIETIKGSRGKQTFNEVLVSYLSSHFKNIKIDSVNINITDSALVVTGIVNASNVIMQVENVNYLSQSILMFPHSFPKKIAENEKLLFYETMQRDFEFHITIEKNFKMRPVSNEQFSENGFDFRYNASASSSDIIINYSITSDAIEVTDSNRKSYNKMNDQIVKVFNKKIAYE